VSTTNGSCTGPAPKTKGGTLNCELGTLAKGASAGTQSVEVKITARANQGVITNAGHASTVTPDPVGSNNTATTQTTVTRK
jgi:hypothetical protein